MVDVLVIGGGNAALCAALTAREAGASVLLLEAAPREWRGGNSQHTRNLRCMHDAPQDVLVDAYPEEEYWQDLLKVTGGADRREAGPPGDPRLGDLPAWMRSARRALPAVAVGHAAHGAHQRLLHGRRQGAGQRLLPQRRALGVRGALRRAGGATRAATTGASSRPCRRRASASRRAAACSPPAASSRTASGCARRGAQRARRVAGRQLPDPRHALQHRRAAPLHARRRRRRGRRPDAGAHGGDRRARAAVRRRHLHAHRLRVARHRRQPQRRALLRRGRGLLAQALRDLGPAGRAAAGPDRLLDHRRQGDRPLHAAGVPGCARADTLPRTGARRSGSTRRAFMQTIDAYNAACRPGTFDHTVLDDCRTEGLEPAKTHWARADRHAAVLRLRAAARHHVHLPRAEGRTRRPRCASAAGRARTCSRPAR